MLRYFPPMGVYQILFEFMDACGEYMGTEGTHPWAQGFPLTTQLPGGPELPGSIAFSSSDLRYPPANGIPQMLEAVQTYYNTFYEAELSTENIAIFAGGRPGIFAIVAFLMENLHVLIEETEYTPYYDLLQILKRPHSIVTSDADNLFKPTLADYRRVEEEQATSAFVIKSNPCNPTGVVWRGEQLKELVDYVSEPNRGGLIDEAYEFFNEAEPESALKYVDNIDETNLFVVGAATKGLQVPGMRVGWVVASRRHIEILRNYSSIAMGGVARPSQLYVSKLLEIDRVSQARAAVGSFFNEQRRRYHEGLSNLGLQLFTGQGGFYHWGRLPAGLTADSFNRRLYEHKAAILPGPLCDMYRRGEQSPMRDFVRFSFGPLLPETYEENIRIMKTCLDQAN